MKSYIQIDNKDILLNLKNHQEDEIAYVKDQKKFYLYKNNEWNEVRNPNEEVFSLSLYEMNKMILAELPSLNDEEIQNGKNILREYILDLKHLDKYYTLLCHELKYFTVFVEDNESCLEDKDDIVNVIFECINNIGQIKSIERTQDMQAIEIWVTVSNSASEEETYVMYFFNYGKGIVPCRI